MNKLGLIGYPLGHSWSPEIHAFFLKEPCYGLYEVPNGKLMEFFRMTDLMGFNVTIPYKQDVMAYLTEIDETAKRIGAVNTVVRRSGSFIGYNTDYIGLVQMLKSNGIDLAGKHAVILGSGGVSKAIKAAIETLGGTYEVASTSAKPETITYDEMYAREGDFSVLFNATPLGMSPNEDAVPADLSKFTNLEAVIDAVANPLRTSLLFEAKTRGLKALGGFEMLVRQALAADELFFGQPMDHSMVRPCMNHLLKARRSIVLIGMPTCGKSTIAKAVQEKTGRPLVEMDAVIEKRLGTTIRECFETKGEEYFRKMESDLCAELTHGNAVISCGGGVIRNKDNMRLLSRNGLVFWIDRDPDLLFGSGDRPLSRTKEDILRLYNERVELYRMYADIRVVNNGNLEDAVNAILSESGDLQ